MAESRIDKTKIVCDTIGIKAVLEQLTEECAELQQACLKLIRKIDDTNPTPKTKDEIIENIKEEIADVQLCIECLPEYIRDKKKIVRWKQFKIDRWLQRLSEKHERTEKNV